MLEAYIVDGVRTPRGRAVKGHLRDIRPVDLLKPLFKALEQRSRIDSSIVEDVVLGCVTAVGSQGANIAKIAALYAGWSASVAGITVNRFCCSGLDALNFAAAQLTCGVADVMVAGGVESLSSVPMFSDKGAWFSDPDVSKTTRFLHMGIAADLIATLGKIERSSLDEFALRSHERARTAQTEKRFASVVVPIKNPAGESLTIDESVRDIDLQKLNSMQPIFGNLDDGRFDTLALSQYPQLKAINHLHHVATSPAQVDGAALLLLANEQGIATHSLRPKARIVQAASASAEPVVMLTGHIFAAEKLLARAGLKAADIDLWEVNESFAASVINFQNHFSIDSAHLNVNGGAIALGHPLGATGGVLIITLMNELIRQGKKRGIAAIPGGAGVGVATLIEIVE